MSMGDFWKDVKPDMKYRSSIKKDKNLQNGTAILDREGIPYEVKNKGIHYVVDGNVDYWPTTGKFIDRTDKKHRRGIFNLVNHIKGRFNEEDIDLL